MIKDLLIINADSEIWRFRAGEDDNVVLLGFIAFSTRQ
jgi:hypothetical protein